MSVLHEDSLTYALQISCYRCKNTHFISYLHTFTKNLCIFPIAPSPIHKSYRNTYLLLAFSSSLPIGSYALSFASKMTVPSSRGMKVYGRCSLGLQHNHCQFSIITNSLIDNIYLYPPLLQPLRHLIHIYHPLYPVQPYIQQETA